MFVFLHFDNESVCLNGKERDRLLPLTVCFSSGLGAVFFYCPGLGAGIPCDGTIFSHLKVAMHPVCSKTSRIFRTVAKKLPG